MRDPDTQPHSKCQTRQDVQNTCDLLNLEIMNSIRLYLQARTDPAGLNRPDVAALIDGIAEDLLDTTKLLAARIDGLGGSECATVLWNRDPRPAKGLQSDDELRAQLLALVSSFVAYDSSLRDTLVKVHASGDLETELLVSHICVASSRNLWLIQTWLEAAVMRSGFENLPRWKPALRHHLSSKVSG